MHSASRPPKRKWSYPIAALVLGFGAPVGMFTLRWAVSGFPLSLAWAMAEIAGDALTYAYVEVSTTAVFASLGYFLGRRADALEASSNTDPLTGLPNRRHLYQALKREVQRSRRYGSPLAFLLLDVDRLKRINDELGHDAGDRALVRVARALVDNCRATDLAARWGGDEFAVLAPGSSATEALNLAERIRTTLARPLDTAPVVVSIGVTDIEQSGPDPDVIQSAADQALYEAKSSGRNRAVISRHTTSAGRQASQ